MKRQELENILKEYYGSEHTVTSILVGRRKPNGNIRYQIEVNHNVPFEAWNDIKYFMSNSKKNVKQQGKKPNVLTTSNNTISKHDK